MTKTLPQLALDIKPDFAGMRFPVWGFRKIDGVRGCHVTGKFTGRSLEDMPNTALVEKFSRPGYEGFDGELTIDGYLRNCDLPATLAAPDKPGDKPKTLCSLTTGITSRGKIKKGETALPTNVVWNLFDYLHPDYIDAPYEDRYAALAELVGDGADPAIHLLPYVVIEDAEQAQAFIDECILLGYEGGIFRDPKANHKHGRATAKANDFWRFKPASVKDCVIVGIEEAMENQNEAKTNALGRTERSSHKENKVGKGMVGVFLARDVDAAGAPVGPVLRLGPGSASHAQRLAWFNAPEQIVGWPAEYCSLDTGVKDAPRQARFVRRREKFDQAAERAA
jgi:DNA ligase-1